MLEEVQPSPKLMGQCAGCSRGIPLGYVPAVTKWEVVRRNGFSQQKPKEMWCKECRQRLEGEPRHRRRRPEPFEPEIVLSAKDVAIRLWNVMSDGEAHGSKTWAEMAELEYGDGEVIKAVLRRLRDAGKVEKVEGRWRKK